MSKSNVSFEKRLCPVCCEEHLTDSLLLDTRGRDSLERETLTGWGLCPEHQKLADDGYIALIAIDPARSTTKNGAITLEGAWRTGAIAHIRRSAWPNLFDMPLPDGALAFIEQAAFDELEQRAGGAQE